MRNTPLKAFANDDDKKKKVDADKAVKDLMSKPNWKSMVTESDIKKWKKDPKIPK
jgi:hypothetical protein